MIHVNTRVKIAGEGKGTVSDLIIREGQAFAVVALDNGRVIEVNGPEMEVVFQ